MNASLPIRGTDGYGSGHYLASRGTRKHHGIDYACYPGTLIYPHLCGKVTRIGWPYSNDIYRYVQVTAQVNGEEYDLRYFYLEPKVKEGEFVMPDDAIGEAQDLSLRYPPKETGAMTNHCHFEVKHNGRYFDPEKFLEKINS